MGLSERWDTASIFGGTMGFWDSKIWDNPNKFGEPLRRADPKFESIGLFYGD